MNVLEIACGFSYSNIYKNLFYELYNKDIDINVYVPQHTNSNIEELNAKDYPYNIQLNMIIKPLDKYLYFSKIINMRKDIESKFELSKIEVIHAHSLFSDGGVAYELYKKYKIPYIVAVRSTDVSQYFKKAKHLKPYAMQILKNSSLIVFLSKSYRDNVLRTYVTDKVTDEIIKKSIIIPNGISSFWLDNIYNDRPPFDFGKEAFELIFVGQITKRKNIESVIRASTELSFRGRKKVNLTIVGEIKDQKYYDYLSSVGEFNYKGYCNSEVLIDYYRSSDLFVMPSITETFGLVYVEAMSQGVPVIYTRGQGFDGQFDEGDVGYGVDPNNIEDIISKIICVFNNYDEISKRCTRNSIRFDWRIISDDYINLYKSISKAL